MPARRKPTSTNKKKAEQQLKRAIKRGDVAPEPKKPTPHRKPKGFRLGPTGQPIGSENVTVESARRLQSTFIKLPENYLEETKRLASTVPLQRPIMAQQAVFASYDHGMRKEDLTCPRRPKWRFDMTKIEVEHNEEGVFKKWVEQADQTLAEWQVKSSEMLKATTEPEDSRPPSSAVPASPSYYERNIEVWRQLWRVTEISQIILVLLDSRCPILHYPPSLAAYLESRKAILVLTKVDITGPTRVEAWNKYLHAQYPHLPIVSVESYTEKEITAVHQGRAQYEPSIPHHFRQKLIDAIKKVHAEMLEPPERVKSNPSWFKKWVPPVKRNVDWDGLLNATGAKVGAVVGGPAVPQNKLDVDGSLPEMPENQGDGIQEPEVLTIGLIGQPNVGKSSLLNALFGARRVRASKTPGKTKHFQTLYWTSDVRLVDCPGLVMPNYIPMEMQVLAGILPISRVSAVPLCAYNAANFLPIERIYKLVHPTTNVPLVKDKRTWREGMKPEELPDVNRPTWTAIDILTAYADAKGWVTAKAGRPDVHRAGNALLRALAEGKISWAFWPPDTPQETLSSELNEAGLGIWIPQDKLLDPESEQLEESEEEAEDASAKGASSEEEMDSDVVEEFDENNAKTSVVGRFGALEVYDESEDDEIEDEGE